MKYFWATCLIKDQMIESTPLLNYQVSVESMNAFQWNVIRTVVNLIYIYEDCLVHLGIREQKQILVIENRFIVFQNIPH